MIHTRAADLGGTAAKLTDLEGRVAEPSRGAMDVSDSDGDCGWQMGDEKALSKRTFTLPRASVSLSILQREVGDRPSLWATGDGGVVWEATEATLAHLDAAFGNGELAGMHVLECGAGTGVCGLACAALGAARVTLTDLPSCIDHMAANLSTQTADWAARVEVLPLIWGSTPDALAPDIVVCCDCLYRAADYPALAATLRHLSARRTVVSWMQRGRDEESFIAMIREEPGVQVTFVRHAYESSVRIVHIDRQAVATAEDAAGAEGVWAAVVGTQHAKGAKDVLKARGWLASGHRPGSVGDGLLGFPLADGTVEQVRLAVNASRELRAASEPSLRDVLEIRHLSMDALAIKKKAPQGRQPPGQREVEEDDDDDEERISSSSKSRPSTWQPRSFGGGLASRNGADLHSTDGSEEPLPAATPIRRFTYAASSDESAASWLRRHVIDTREPAVVSGLPLGACRDGWTPERLARAQCAARSVSVHVCAGHTVDLAGHRAPNTPRNFEFRSMSFAEAVARCSGRAEVQSANDVTADATAATANGHSGETLEPLLGASEKYYLRSVGLDPHKDAADFPRLFPDLAAECALVPPSSILEQSTTGEELEPLLDPAAYHSSVLRLASDDTQLWTHFDVMDNCLAQMAGRKRVVMWPPSEDENLYVEGSSSRVADIDAWNDAEFPRFRRAVPARCECELGPGDVLFIPALWFHNVTSIGFSVAVNVFWRSHQQHRRGRGRPDAADNRKRGGVVADHNLYSAKDLYGNKDPPAATRALEVAAAAAADLRSLPEPFRSFYARRAARVLMEVCADT